MILTTTGIFGVDVCPAVGDRAVARGVPGGAPPAAVDADADAGVPATGTVGGAVAPPGCWAVDLLAVACRLPSSAASSPPDTETSQVRCLHHAEAV